MRLLFVSNDGIAYVKFIIVKKPVAFIAIGNFLQGITGGMAILHNKYGIFTLNLK